MEAEKKRKKSETSTAESVRRLKKDSKTVAPQPTDEEVEEFFAILRRMRDAVKYFENNNTNGDATSNLVMDNMLPVTTEKVNGVKDGDNGGRLDLNCVPDGESNSD